MEVSFWSRWWVHDAFVLGASVFVVGLAIVLTPSTGFLHLFGLEIPEMCMWRRLFGVSCPGCGLTRSFTFMGHGSVGAAWEMNKIGPVFFLLVTTQIPYRAWRLWRDGTTASAANGPSASA